MKQPKASETVWAFDLGKPSDSGAEFDETPLAVLPWQTPRRWRARRGNEVTQRSIGEAIRLVIRQQILPLKMHAAVHDERAPKAREHFALDEIGRVRVALLEPLRVVGASAYEIPIDRRIAQEDPKPSLARPRRVHGADRSKQRLAPRAVALRGIHLRGVAPEVAQQLRTDIFSPHEPIDPILIACVAALEDDVVCDG